LLDGLDRRFGNLPMEAEARAKAIEEALSDTLERLTQAGRQAANETAALDIAFQDRLRESYAALGEVVTRLGGLSGVLPMPETKPIAAKPEIAPIVTPVVAPVVAPVADVAPQTAAPEPVKAPAPEPRPQPAMARKVPPEPKPLPPLPKRTSLSGLQASVPAAPAPTPASDAAAPSGFATQMSYHPQSTTSAAPASAHTDAQVPPPAPQPDVALPIEGNTRLRISSPIPVEDDPVTAAEPVAETNWSWKQLLSSMDDKGAKSSANQISNLVGELDLETALPSTALDKIRVLAMKSRDQSRRGTREYARAEVRAMRQKLTSDPALRAIVVRFVETRKEAATKGRLSGNPARVYFVADAALEA
jgi:hypothetical protein